jgi:RNA polymerase sigma-70 factor (ECF subfamily)
MNSSDRVQRERGLRRAVLAGDETAWRTWYDEVYPVLAAFVAWRCAGQPDIRDEVIQDTWLIAVRRIRAFDPAQANFATWLRGIAANLLRNRWRQLKRRTGVESLNGKSAEAIASRVSTETDQTGPAIAKVLAELPERYEAVLRAKYLDQQTVSQIAESWKETTKTIESLLTRARQSFRETYGQLR